MGDVFERDLHLVNAGDAATITTTAYPGERFTGRVNYVSDVIDPLTRTAKVRVSVPNPRGRLKPEMFASIALGVGASSPALTVPASAVFTEDGHSWVYVVDEGRSLHAPIDRRRSGRRRRPPRAGRPSRRATASSRTARCCCAKKKRRGPADGQANRFVRPLSAAVPRCSSSLLFIAGGVAAFRSLPVEAFPDVSDIQTTVITLFPGHAPEEVEKQVTIPLEIALAGVPHAVRMFSHTQFGLSFLTLTFDDQVDDYFARQRVLERLQQADLPAGHPAAAGAALDAGRRAVSLPTRRRRPSASTELRSIEDWVVERALRLSPGVADVVSRGGFIKQYQVSLDLARMKAYGVTLQQVFNALGRGNANAGGNYLEQGEQQYLIRGIGLLRSPDDIGSIVVAEHAGTPLLIRDFADVTVGAVPRQGLVGRNDEDDVVTGIVLMRKGENPSEVLTDIKERIDRLNSSVLPTGVTDRAVLRSLVADLDDADDRVQESARRRSARHARALRLPAKRARGRHRRADDSAVAPRDVHRSAPARHSRQPALARRDGFRHHRRRRGHRRRERVSNACRAHDGRRQDQIANRSGAPFSTRRCRSGRPTLFSMLIIIVAHIPIFTLQRHEGRIFAPMAYTVSSALVGSLLFSLTLVPLLCFYLLGRGVKHEENALVEFCQRVYQRVLKLVLARPIAVIASAIAAFVCRAGARAARSAPSSCPSSTKGRCGSTCCCRRVSRWPRRRGCARRSGRSSVGFPEVTQVISQTGRPEDGTDPKTINMAEFFVDLKPPSEWTRKIEREDLAAQIEDAVDRSARPRSGDVAADSRQRAREHLADRRPDRDQGLRRRSGRAARKGRQRCCTSSLAFAACRARSSTASARSRSCRSKSIGRVRRGTGSTSLMSRTSSTPRSAERSRRKSGRASAGSASRSGCDERDRRDIGGIKNILVDTPARAARAACGSRESIGPERQHEYQPRIGHAARGDRRLHSRARHGRHRRRKRARRSRRTCTFPPGYYVTFGGEFENQERAMKRLELIVPISVFLIFILLFNAFGSVRNAARHPRQHPARRHRRHRGALS